MSLTDYIRGHEAGLIQGQTVGESLERERLIELLLEYKVIRIDALGSTVFVNCDSLQVEYLPDAFIKGEK